MSDEVPPPRVTPKPYTNGAEPITGIFNVKTGRTRRAAINTAIIAAVVTLLTPLVAAVAARIAPPAPLPSYVDPALMEELRAIRDAHFRDGGGR